MDTLKITEMDIDKWVVVAIQELAESGALTAAQAERLCREWRTLDDDLWAMPWYRSVGEHCRHIVERMLAHTP